MHAIALVAGGLLVILIYSFLSWLGEITTVLSIGFIAFLFWLLFIIQKMFKKNKVLTGKVEYFEEYGSLKGQIFLKNVRLILNNGENKFFKRMMFSRSLANKIDKSMLDGTFFISNSFFFKKEIFVWCLITGNKSFVSMNDLEKPKKVLYIVCLLLGLYILFTLLWIALFEGEDIKATLIFSTVPFICILHCLFSYIKETKLFSEKLQLLDKHGVQRPLG